MDGEVMSGTESLAGFCPVSEAPQVVLRIASGVVCLSLGSVLFNAAAICGKFRPRCCNSAASCARASFRGLPGVPCGIGTNESALAFRAAFALLQYPFHLARLQR